MSPWEFDESNEQVSLSHADVKDAISGGTDTVCTIVLVAPLLSVTVSLT